MPISEPSHERAPETTGSGRRRLAEWDRRASAFFSTTLPHPPWLTRPVAALSFTGNYGASWIVLGAAAGLAAGGRPHSFAACFLYVSAGVVGCELVTYLVKLRFRRVRPAKRVPGPQHMRLPVTPSFPSSHCSMSVMGALTLSQLEPSWWPALAALAVFYAFSRVYLRVHYLLDVVAGLALGAVLGVCYVALVRV